MFSISVPLLIGCLLNGLSDGKAQKKNRIQHSREEPYNLQICSRSPNWWRKQMLRANKGPKVSQLSLKTFLNWGPLLLKNEGSCKWSSGGACPSVLSSSIIANYCGGSPFGFGKCHSFLLYSAISSSALLRHKLFKAKNGPISFWLQKLFISFVTSTGYT